MLKQYLTSPDRLSKIIQLVIRQKQFIINALRAAGALTISLVAEVGGKVVGHIAFSPVTISDGSHDWYGVGPVSVLPEFQKQGIGKSLIQEGLSLLKAAGAKGCVLVGDPRYYERFGFRNLPDLILDGVPQRVTFLLCRLTKIRLRALWCFIKVFLRQAKNGIHANNSGEIIQNWSNSATISPILLFPHRSI